MTPITAFRVDRSVPPGPLSYATEAAVACTHWFILLTEMYRAPVPRYRSTSLDQCSIIVRLKRNALRKLEKASANTQSDNCTGDPTRTTRQYSRVGMPTLGRKMSVPVTTPLPIPFTRVQW